jgi:uncharacterized protein YigA (DUF484 family)
VHRLALALLAARDLQSVVSIVNYNLREDFAVPHVVLRAWSADGGAAAAELAQVSGATREFTTGLAGPHCTRNASDGPCADVFAEASLHLKSFCYIPLRESATFGLLALASEDGERFYPEMGTVYLKRIGDMVATALARNLAQ